MTVFWTDTAIESLEIIFDFYSFQANKTVAKSRQGVSKTIS